MGTKTISLANNGVFWWHMQNPNKEKVRIHLETGQGHFSLFEKKGSTWTEHQNDIGALVAGGEFNTSTNEWAVEVVATGTMTNKFVLTANGLNDNSTSWNPTKPPAK